MSTNKMGDSKCGASSATSDKIKGRTDEVIGKVKAKVGDLVGNQDLEDKGNTQNVAGKAERMKGEAKEKMADAKDAVKHK